MRQISLIAGLLLALALPVYAYVQPGHLVTGSPRTEATEVEPKSSDLPLSLEYDRPASGARPVEQHPSQPAPEPATMAMASMGLLALGAAIRRNRAR